MRTAIPKSNFKRIHHRQPKLYLGGFCEEPSFLWVYEHGKPYNPGIQKRHKFNPCKLGVTELGEKDAYATVKADGKRDFEAIENRHQIIEHRADVVLRKIRAQSPISIAEKDIFAEYIQNMLWRTKKHEEDIRPRLDMIQKNGPSRKIALELAQAGQFTLSREHYDAIKYLQSDGGKKDLILKSLVTRHPAIHQILNAMSWMFYIRGKWHVLYYIKRSCCI